MHDDLNWFYFAFSELEKLDWHNFEKIYLQVERLLTRIYANRSLISDLLLRMSQNKELIQLSGPNESFKKIILYRLEPSGIELRLHIFNRYDLEKPHDHRLSFSTVVIDGCYTNVLYQPNKPLPINAIKTSDLQPVCYTKVSAGMMYSLSHNAIHATIAQPDTVTLLIRGPYVKPAWLNGDASVPKSFEQSSLIEIINTLQNLKIVESRNYLEKFKQVAYE